MKTRQNKVTGVEKIFKDQWDKMGMEEVFSGGRDVSSMDIGMGKKG